MIFRQLQDPETSTYTYLLADPETGEAALIDPVKERVPEYIALLSDLNLRLVYTLETHVHADHVTGGAALRDQLGSQTVVAAAAEITCPDHRVQHSDLLQLGAVSIEVIATPGHTDSCLSYRVGDKVFTGDALFIDGCGRTDFQQGDAGKLHDSVTQRLFTLPAETEVFPGHDYHGRSSSTIGAERESNSRLGAGRSREDFIALMSELSLNPPKHIERSVPANQRCGQEAGDLSSERHAELVNLSRKHPQGFHNMDVLTAQAAANELVVIDVREAYELNGPLGMIAGAQHRPLSQFQLDGLDPKAAVLVVCRSGSRSQQVAAVLASMGFQRVFNLMGGMVQWNLAGLPKAIAC